MTRVVEQQASSILMNRSDDELGRELFGRLFIRFEALRKKDRSIRVLDAWSVGFKLNRNGSLLVVNQGHQSRLIEIALLRTQKPGSADALAKPWRATICCSVDRKRLALVPGPEGSLDEIIERLCGRFSAKLQLTTESGHSARLSRCTTLRSSVHGVH